MQGNAKFQWNERNFRRHGFFFFKIDDDNIRLVDLTCQFGCQDFEKDNVCESSWTQREKHGLAENVFVRI